MVKISVRNGGPCDKAVGLVQRRKVVSPLIRSDGTEKCGVGGRLTIVGVHGRRLGTAPVSRVAALAREDFP